MRSAHRALDKVIEPKVYEYGFLKRLLLTLGLGVLVLQASQRLKRYKKKRHKNNIDFGVMK